MMLAFLYQQKEPHGVIDRRDKAAFLYVVGYKFRR